jgi:hypothetical protein
VKESPQTSPACTIRSGTMKRSKHGNRKVIYDGMTFDSKKEFRRWQELLDMEAAGKIQNLQRQVKFVLIPAQRDPDRIGKRGGIIKGKVIEREVAYIADFVYEQNGELVVEDVKGYKGGVAYNLFVMKRKMLLYLYGIRVKEI